MRLTKLGVALFALLTCHVPSSARTSPQLLVVSGPQGSRSFTAHALRDFLRPLTAGRAALRDSTGTMTSVSSYRGIPIRALANQVGWPQDWDLVVSTRDHKQMRFAYSQHIEAYDPATGHVSTGHPDLYVLLALERDGKRIEFEKGEPLRIVIISEEGLATDVGWSPSDVVRLDIVPGDRWSLGLHGALDEQMSRATFDSLAATETASWRDESSRLWTGVPLRILIGRVDDGLALGEDAFNDSLASLGYVVAMVGADQTSVAVNSESLRGKEVWLLANAVDGQELTDSDRPIRLVGPRLADKRRIGRVANIVLYSPRGQLFFPYPDAPW